MKKLVIILVALGLTAGASAQKGIRGGYHYRAPRVSIGIGVPLSPYYYSPFYGPAFGYPFYGGYYNSYRRPSRLDVQIQDIRNVYQAKIKAARKDKSEPRSERRQKVRELKVEREQAIADARNAYYHPRSRPRVSANNNNNNNDYQQ